MKKTMLIAIGIIFLIVIQVYFLTLKKRKLRKKLKNKLLEDGETDYISTATNIAFSISKARKLFKVLIVKIHPDKFTDSRKEKATEISARITKAKHNYNELINLQVEIEAFLKEKQ